VDPSIEFLTVANAYPGQVGLDNGSLIHGSGLTVYFKLKLTFIISGPYGPTQKLLSLPTNPYSALLKVVAATGLEKVSLKLKVVQLYFLFV
jgi:hypothetical protein